jgi:hypothetical protein
VPGSPAGRYEPLSIEKQANCAHVGFAGRVVDGDDEGDDPIAGVTIRVVGDEDEFKGPYYSTTNADGEYGFVIGEFGDVSDGVEFRADVFGDGVDTNDEPEWNFTEDCHANDALQVMRIIWSKK